MNKELQDLVWSILPKEFKEEVKRIGNILNKDASVMFGTIGQLSHKHLDLFVKLFGIHNLTSDPEGEEVLTVPRKRVQEMFGEAQKAVPTCEHDRGFRNAELTLLRNLFGTKCLPDEKIDPERMVNTIKESIEYPVPDKMLLDGIAEQKPAEPNVKNLSAWQDEDDPDLAQRLAFLNSLSNEHSEPKYHKGDKVLYKGRLKVVRSEMYPNRCYSISLPNGQSPFCRHESDLEPYTEPKESLCMDAKGFYRKETDTQGNKVKVRIPSGETEPYTKPKEESPQMKPIESKVSVYLATKEENEEFRQLLNNNGFTWSTGASLTSQSVWLPDEEETKIHNIYPDKTVTYSGDITPDILSFYKFKKQYFEENVNLSQETANCDKHFDNILKDGFSKERRLNIAAMVMQGIMANPYWTEKRMRYAMKQGSDKESVANEFINTIVEDVMELTDALIAEAGKGNKK